MSEFTILDFRARIISAVSVRHSISALVSVCSVCMNQNISIQRICYNRKGNGASGGKTSDRLAICIECSGCQRVFSSWWSYDQHRHIAYPRVLCWARYQQNEPVCKAAPKHVDCCARSQRSFSFPNTWYSTSTKKLRIVYILHILWFQRIPKN